MNNLRALRFESKIQKCAGKSLTERDVRQFLRQWKNKKARKSAESTIEKWGLPDEATLTHLVWHTPLKNTLRCEIYDEAVPHNFPRPHEDFLTLWINYQVPPNKVEDVLSFDGSVTLKVTAGEMGATCGDVEADLLTLNLADMVATDQITVSEARQIYYETVVEKKHAKLMKDLQFKPPSVEKARFTDEKHKPKRKEK